MSSTMDIPAGEEIELRGDMTIEEVLQVQLDARKKVVNDRFDANIAALRAKYETVKEAAWRLHADLLAGEFKENLHMGDPVAAAAATTAVLPVAPATGRKAGAESAKRPAKSAARVVPAPDIPAVRVRCIAAHEPFVQHYIGREWLLQPTVDKGCKIGRARTVMYTKKGMSLSEDPEVSTSHGEVRYNPETGRLYYIDLGSTNGSIAISKKNKETKVLPHTEHELVSGARWRFGVCIYEFTFP